MASPLSVNRLGQGLAQFVAGAAVHREHAPVAILRLEQLLMPCQGLQQTVFVAATPEEVPVCPQLPGLNSLAVRGVILVGLNTLSRGKKRLSSPFLCGCAPSDRLGLRRGIFPPF